MTAVVPAAGRPGLIPRVRMSYDKTRDRHVILSPEMVIVLNPTGADILGLCDGVRTVADIVAELGARYDRVVDDEVQHFLARLVTRRCLEILE